MFMLYTLNSSNTALQTNNIKLKVEVYVVYPELQKNRPITQNNIKLKVEVQIMFTQNFLIRVL